MAVLMSYHKLIERESKNIDWFWKFGTIFILLITVTCCMVASYSFHKLTEAFDDHCILDANLSFIAKTPETTSSASAWAIASASSGFETELSDQPMKGSALLLRKYSNLEENEIIFLSTHTINEPFTNWGSRVNCEWALHLPIFQCCFGIILVSFFVICGKGGKAEEEGSFLSQPWRIVMPALVFFLVMMIITGSYILLVHRGMKVFCKSLTAEIPSVSCQDAMNAFKIQSGDIEPNVFYILLYAINWIVFGLWLFLVVVMILRIIFVIDFQLVRVTIKTCEYENADERSSFKVIESPKNGTEATTIC